ncbi:cell division protein ZipA [Ferrimonas gelatinilytica]|uniref:Cell division protein ZipA n=1 Tax=Ferrimonas gelatinilytica TaxID=1255257 RepID=A0ABP9S1C7_9GAMM
MDDMRIVFIVVGLLAIVGLCVHGFWSLRNSSPARNRRTKAARKKAPVSRVEPLSGGDEGVGPVRVTAKDKPASPMKATTTESAPQPQTPLATPKSAPSTPSEPAVPLQQSLLGEEEFPEVSKPRPSRPRPARREPEMGDDPFQLSLPEEEEEIRLDSTASPEKAAVAPNAGIPKDAGEAVAEQLRSVEEEKPQAVAPAEPEEATLPQEPVDVLVLHVVGRKGPILGEELLPNLTTMGYKFGEMAIFHRHQHSAGTGPVLFSLANMMQPGTFDPDNMEQFTTEGVALFMTLPSHTDARINFSMMLGSARGLAALHDAELLDDQRQPWSDGAEARYLERIRRAELSPA